MDITTGLTDLLDDLRRGRVKIANKGGTINSLAGFDELVNSIDTIPTVDNVGTIIDDSTALIKTVPDNSVGHCYLNKLGGMSHKCNNLLPFPYLNGEMEINGVTFTPQEDGGVYVKGTASETAHAVYYLNMSLNLFSGYVGANKNVMSSTKDGYCISKSGSGATSVGFASEKVGNKNHIYIIVAKGTSADGVVYPMINVGETALPFELYYEGLRDTKVTEIVSEGANLFDESQIKYATTRNGVQADNWGVVEDGILISKMGIYNGTLQWQPFAMELDTGTYTISADCYVSTGGAPNLQVRFGVNTIVAGSSTIYANGVSNLSAYDTWERRAGIITITQKDTYYLALQSLGNSSQYSNMDVRFKNICITKGSMPTEYKPYVGTIGTTVISEAIRNLDGYGKGTSTTYYNYIDFERKVFVQNTRRKVFDGTEYWQNFNNAEVANNPNGIATASILLGEKVREGSASILCSHYDFYTVATQAEAVKEGVMTIASGYLVVRIKPYQTREEWQTYLAELYANGNPFAIEYALATPIETPIDIPDALIKVEGGGTLTFVNENEYNSPSIVTYQTINR